MLQDCVREDLGSVAAASVLPDRQPAAFEPVLWTTVFRGCVQVVLSAWVLGGEGEEGAAPAGVGNAAWTEHLLRRLAERFDEMEQEGGGSVRGVSVQVGQEVAVLGDPSQGTQLPGVLPLHGASDGGGGSNASVRLLQMSPPSASLAGVAEPSPLTVRLLLHSPAPQMARVLVMSQGQGAASSAELPGASGLPSGLHTRAQLLELPVQLVGGVQEVEVKLEEGQLAGVMMGVAAGAGPDGADGVAAAESGAVSALRVMMVGPAHAAENLDGQHVASVAAPLVHWVAPPLLLLPAAAAAEVCSVWEAMQQDTSGGLAAMEEEVCEEGSSAAHAGTAHSSDSGKPLASAELQSSLWWSHMAPLLGDLAYVARACPGQEQQGDEEGADPVAQTLLPYLRANGMTRTLSLLASRRGLRHSPQREREAHVSQGSAATSATATGPLPPNPLPPMQPGASQPAYPTPPSCCSSSGKTPHEQQPSAYTGAYPVGNYGHSTTGRPISFLLWRPFSPPSLELRYQQWRLQRLAHMAPYALFLEAGVGLSVLLGQLSPLPLPARGSGGGAGVGAGRLPLLVRLAQTVVRGVLRSLATVLGLAVVYDMVVLRPRRVLCTEEQQGQQRQQQQQGRQGPAGAVRPGTTPAVRISPRDVVWYRLAACVAGPAALLLCAVLTNMGFARLDPRYIGSTRAVYGSFLIQAVIVPCLQQMSKWEAVAAAPLMGLGEALVLMHMQPTWGVWRAGAVVLMWRLVAVGVSAVWERRSRQQFVQGQQGVAGTVGVLKESGAGEGAGGGVPKGDHAS